MTQSWVIGVLAAAALVSGTASATQIVVGESRLVIDVEFWGRERIVSPDPEGGNNDVITFGDPVHGKFRIFPDNAPSPRGTGGASVDGQIYGQITDRPSGAAFVTSHWLSPFPKGPVVDITHQVSPFAGSVPDDHVIVGDRVRMRENLSGAGFPRDWLQVSDRFGPGPAADRLAGEQLMIGIYSPLDFIDGFGLEQAFELNDLQEKENTSAFGFFRAKVDTTATAVAFFDFAVDRIRVSPRVCKP
ncbi:MAG TPA: hypothetical protein VLI71_01675 [Gammaproteobacteria bacterium]|nr:hypothetical protein [Gammaproteobacteria bacterium]